MDAARFEQISQRFAALRIAVLGDFCLDRYLEIDPARGETSIETGLPVHNVVSVRSQPGAAGTILNNLVALGVGGVIPIGFCGEDGEGWELERALRAMPHVDLRCFLRTPARRTFSYTKPLIFEPSGPPAELSRLDLKNWSPTPPDVEEQLIASLLELAPSLDAVIVMDQVDVAGTGVVTDRVRGALRAFSTSDRPLPVVADCRRGLRGWPPCIWKMNAREFSALENVPAVTPDAVARLARMNAHPVFVTQAEHGMLGAEPSGHAEHVPAFPVHGEIDIVGAGDAVSASLTTALAAGAGLREAMEFAMAAASIVIHQLGTTGTAPASAIGRLLLPDLSQD